jgi:fructosamine-3-kinase
MNRHVKQRADAPAGFFEAEAAGLRWLADAHGARVASVIDVSPTRLVVEAIEPARPTADAAGRFGRALAVTHAAGAAAFGAPPTGYDGPLFIGNRPLPAARESAWGIFYARDRVLPYLEVALRVGGATDAAARLVRAACDRIPLHQLHPLAVHAAGHGPAYGRSLEAAADAVLALP